MVLATLTNFKFSLVGRFPRAITIRIEVLEKVWACSAIYTIPIPAMRPLLWQHLVSLRS